MQKTIHQIRPEKIRGQAITEMTVTLVAICVVILGMIMLTVLGTKGIRNVISAREEADKQLASGNSGGGGNARYISVWKNVSTGDGDGLQFTADDTPSTGGTADTQVYRDELVSTDKNLDLPALAAAGKNEYYSGFSNMDSSMLFLSAANLSAGTASDDDPMNDQRLYDIRKAFQRFGMSTDIRLKDTVYMPCIKSEETEKTEK